MGLFRVLSVPFLFLEVVSIASKRRLRRRSCLNKKRFESQTEAVACCIRMEKAKAVRFKAYKCNFCDGWHVANGLRISPETGELNGGYLPPSLRRKRKKSK